MKVSLIPLEKLRMIARPSVRRWQTVGRLGWVQAWGAALLFSDAALAAVPWPPGTFGNG